MFSRLSKDLLFRSPTYIDHDGKLFTVSPTVWLRHSERPLQRGYELVEVAYIKENEMPHGFRQAIIRLRFEKRQTYFIVGVVGLVLQLPPPLSLVSS